MVYFIGMPHPSYPDKWQGIKVGYVHDEARLKSRIKSFQCGSPHDLTVLAVAPELGLRSERLIHETLRSNPNQWLGREWYKPSQAVRHLIARVRGGYIETAADLHEWARRYRAAQAQGRRAKTRKRRRPGYTARRAALQRAIEDGTLTIRYEKP